MPLDAVSVRNLSLDQLINQSGQVVFCQVLKAEDTFQEAEGVMLPITHYQLQIIDHISGPHQTGITISVSMVRDAPIGKVEGKPILSGLSNIELETGNHYLLFLTHESPIGLCTAVGLQQGCLLCVPTENGFTIQHGGQVTRRGTSYSSFRDEIKRRTQTENHTGEKE